MKNLKRFPKKVTLTVTKNDFKNYFGNADRCPVAMSAKRKFRRKHAFEYIQTLEFRDKPAIGSTVLAKYEHERFGMADYTSEKRKVNRTGKSFKLKLTRVA